MIRRSQPHELDELMALWLQSTTEAHPFISQEYWLESEELVRNSYIPQSQTWVCVRKGKITGFISVLEKRFIGALFVEKAFYGKGVATALMRQAKVRFPVLSLEVYEQNRRARAFYQKQGFITVDKSFNEETQSALLIMAWSADC
jgi:putative acetyltransferase